MAVSKVSRVQDMTTCLMQVPKWDAVEKTRDVEPMSKMNMLRKDR